MYKRYQAKKFRFKTILSFIWFLKHFSFILNKLPWPCILQGNQTFLQLIIYEGFGEEFV